ncbi:MAG: thrombospondin, partial [Nannocystaceae bacterium]|nr:thrombospondin [Nannocystaceae bacterium]
VGLVGLAVLALGSSGCIQDTDCGICDPDNLILESISGINYQSNKVHILSPTCEGDACPPDLSSGTYFIEKIIPCTETEEAQESANAEEYCRLSPLVTAFGIEFIFNNLLDPTSIELVRKRPDNPQLFEVYDWKTDVLQVQGPITRFNGDYVRGGRDEADTISRLINLSCIENVTANGGSFDFESYKDPTTNPCNGFNSSTGLPMKMAENGTIKAARGIWTASGNSCSSPEEGPDTCCSYCDYLLSTKIDRYGVDEAGTKRNANPGISGFVDAIQCGDATNVGTVIDKFAACSGFVASTDRSDEEQTWLYNFCDPESDECKARVEPEQHSLPLFDLLRETHPDLRPANLENLDAKCTTTAACVDVHGLTGTECVGTHSGTGAACLADAYGEGDADSCDLAVCRPQWMATCRFDETTTGAEVAYCQDRRFGTVGSAACLVATDGITDGVHGAGGIGGAGLTDCDENGENCVQRRGGSELAFADWNENGRLTAEEACQGSIYGPSQAGQDGFACDPYYQGNLTPKPLYERDENLPAPARGCVCPDEEKLADGIDAVDSACEDAIRSGCYDSDDLLVEGRAGEYAIKFISRAGGIVYDPAIKGFDWRPADVGGVPRADIENCAENNTDRLVAPLNRHDGWRAADTFTPENFEDFDRAMCSGQEYTVTFNEPGSDNPAYVIDKADNTLVGKSVYKFETAQFHVQPGSGFPTDNLRIGACDDFSLRFSNKYDASPENMSKLQLFRTSCTGEGNSRVCEVTSPDPRCDSANPPPGACCITSPVAGGPNCFDTEPELETALESNACAAPCLTVDIENQFIGEVSVQIDPIEFGQYLEVNEVYRMLAPTAATLVDTQNDPALYQAVFWDACGMPLVAEDAESYAYDFRIDTPKCKEDADNDGIPLSCDNADKTFNPDQADIDGDG